MLIKNLVLIGSVAFAAAKEVTGVFTNFDSLVFQNAGDYAIASPAYPSWIAKLNWVIDGSKETAGDTFTLNMPCVFKFTTSDGVNSVDLKVNNDVFATCKFSPGEIVVPYSQLQCTVAKIVTASTYASGTVNFPITFNVGGSALKTDLEDSTCFTPGNNTVTFNDGPNKLSTTANFQADSPSSGYYDPKTFVVRNRDTPSTNNIQHYVLAGNCPKGYLYGSLGFSLSGGTLDCSSVHAEITDQLNAWYFPKTSSDFFYTSRCTSSGVSISYNNIRAGFRPFIDGLIRQSGSSLEISYTNNYVCSNFDSYNYDTGINWGNYDNSNDYGSNGNVVVVTTKTWTDSTTQVATLPFNTAPGNTKTIEVNVPIPTVTTTTTWTGYQTTTTTVTATPGQTATVIVEIPTKRPPNPTTTQTTTWTGLQTSSLTLTDTPGGTDTVIVEVPSNAQTTTSSTWTGNFTTTITSTDIHGGTDTVIVEVPSNAQATTTSTWTGNFTTTITSTASHGGTDTVIIEVPSNAQTTTTSTWTGNFTTTITSTASHGGTDTVIIEVPSNAQTTTTITWTGNFTTTITSKDIQGGTDTVIVEVPSNSQAATEYSSSIESLTGSVEGTNSSLMDGNQSKSSTRESPLPTTSHSGNSYTPITLSATSEFNSSETQPDESS
ncbi:cell-wall agglutinin N-terminal ligand-sugar binding-domain-containing protein [Scheffersomyces xylosifermentans]|uniref:cell-wall agglutinin N-terminal ligand-sugar binding-domain-containing protein n=1 Tax=Scheffersomyces xylosifermentans TaxID=1304137 RepID=UPI00315D5DF8